MRISEFLTGEPRTKKQIAELAGISPREVELLIHAARLEGVPIASNSDGYWLESQPQKVRTIALRLRNRAMTQLQTASALDGTADRMEQRPVTLWGDPR
jgi:biotin operon repressor